MFSFEKLNVYVDSLDLVNLVYDLSEEWPKSEVFGLTSQFRRATVSICLNIAEGSGRTKKDFRHFLDIARSSCQECIALIEICRRRKLLNDKDYELLYEKFTSIARRISALKKSLLSTMNNQL